MYKRCFRHEKSRDLWKGINGRTKRKYIHTGAKRIDSLYQEKVRLLNQINQNQKGNNTNTFRMEAAKLLIQELPAAMRKGNIEYVRYSLFQLLERIEVDDSEVYFYWSFAK